MESSKEFIRICKVIGDMPPYYKVAEAIWGEAVDIDSDGDSTTPDDTNWRELTITLRPNYEERLDIDPVGTDRDTIKLRATSQEILERAYAFLKQTESIFDA